jgi:hypothetical protein
MSKNPQEKHDAGAQETWFQFKRGFYAPPSGYQEFERVRELQELSRKYMQHLREQLGHKRSS